MKKIISLPKLLLLTVLLVTTLVCLNAQQESTPAKKKAAKPVISQMVVISDANESAESNKTEKPVYFQYKGIANIEEAKQAWIKDNPEIYHRMINGAARPDNAKP